MQSHPKNIEKCVSVVYFQPIISQYDAHPFVSTHMSTLFQVYTFFSANFPGNGVTVLVLIFTDH